MRQDTCLISSEAIWGYFVLPLTTFVQTESASNPYLEKLEQLYKERSLITYNAGTTVPLQSQHLYVICRGIIQLHTIHADVSETIV